MFATIISDCQDPNAVGRQLTRVAALFGSDVTRIVVVGVQDEMAAAGNLVDMLDAADGAEGSILVNVAPRDGIKAGMERWLNGAPFVCFSVGNTMVISSVHGGTLSLVKKLGIVQTVGGFDIPTVMEWAVEQGLLTVGVADKIIGSQFRSFEFLPRVALWLHQGMNIPMQVTDISDVTGEPPIVVWWVDCFGNCKTTLLYEDLGKIRESDDDAIKDLPFYPHLSDVPNGTLAWIIGSSGFGEYRFLEIVLGGGNAAKYLCEIPVVKKFLEVSRITAHDLLEELLKVRLPKK